jgi:hypothetical protein
MNMSAAVRLSGWLASVGGLSWVVMIVETSLRPALQMRGPLYLLLFTALVCIAAGALGIATRQRDRAGLLGTVTIGCAVAGIALVIMGRLAVDLLGAAPQLFLIGLLAFLVSLLLLIATTIWAGVMPRAASWLLLVAVLLLPLFNFDDARVWLGLPFGLAWVWLGQSLVREPPERNLPLTG